MSESAVLLVLAAGWLALFAAAGAGPAILLGAGLSSWLVLAPLLGLAVLPCVLATASLVLTMNVAAFVVLLPAILASMGLAAVVLRRRPVAMPSLREAGTPVVICLVGLAVAITPGLARGAVRPLTYTVADAWLNASKGRWLQRHTVLETADPADLVHRLTEFSGWRQTSDYQRIAIPALNGAFARLAGVAPEETFFPLAAVIFALLPLSLWITARWLGAGHVPAAFASAYGVSAVALTMVVDGAAENLAGVALAPLAVIFALDALRTPTAVAVVRTGLVWAGLAAAYPEYGPPLVVAAAVMGTMRLAEGSLRRAQVLGSLRVLAAATLVAAVTAPYVLVRLTQYYREVSGYALESGAARSLTLENVGAWAFGVVHLYQLRDFPDLSAAESLIAVGLPLALLAVALAGIVHARTLRIALLAPAATTVLLAACLFWYRGDKEYALWKWLALSFPFVALGLALGFALLAQAAPWGRIAAIALAAVGLCSVAYTDLAFTRLIVDKGVAAPREARAVVEDARNSARPRTIFLEGPEATSYPLVGYAAVYSALAELPGAEVSYDAHAPGPGQQGDQLLRPRRPFERYERPGYRYVFTTFAGLETRRRRVAHADRFALDERAPLDVLVVGVSSWTGDAGRTVPYATGPFQLWLDAPTSGPARLEVSTGIKRSFPTLSFVTGGRRLTASVVGEGRRLCVTVPLGSGFTRVDVLPRAAQTPAPRIGTWQTDVARIRGEPEVVSAPGLELRSVSARPGRCD